jgi:hypothetical protein
MLVDADHRWWPIRSLDEILARHSRRTLDMVDKQRDSAKMSVGNALTARLRTSLRDHGGVRSSAPPARLGFLDNGQCGHGQRVDTLIRLRRRHGPWSQIAVVGLKFTNSRGRRPDHPTLTGTV